MAESDWRKYQPVEDAKDAAWREFAKPGAQIPLLSDDGVTTLEIVSAGEDGTVEVRVAKPQ